MREFVFFVECDGETIKKGREYLVMADWKVDGKRGRLEMVFIKRWGTRMRDRLDNGEDWNINVIGLNEKNCYLERK